MKGLKTREYERFERFFEKVQESAKNLDAVFFLDCGEGREFSIDDMDGEDLRGWLITKEHADTFQEEWKNGEPSGDWLECIR